MNCGSHIVFTLKIICITTKVAGKIKILEIPGGSGIGNAIGMSVKNKIISLD
jgi:hypothetical protein